MLTSVGKFAIHKICSELFFNQALHDSRDNRSMADWSIIGWFKSFAFVCLGLMTDFFHWKVNVLHWAERLNMLSNGVEVPPPPCVNTAEGSESGPG